MKTIVLRGNKDCGKTTTVRMVYDQMLPNATAILEPIVEWGDASNLDFSVMMEYEGKKVAFYSMGDLSRLLVAAIRDFKAKGADILVCSCRAYMVYPYSEMAKDEYTILDKTLADTPAARLEANEADRDKIVANCDE